LTRKKFGAYETPEYIFEKYIYPEIKDRLYDYIWVDLFCGSGNLILPILKHLDPSERVEFFRDHIFLYDILPEMVIRARRRARELGIPDRLVEENIRIWDTLRDYPREILDKGLPVYHVTNPPYLYIGYIRKNPMYRFWLDYFRGENSGYQDLYQLALINDLRHGIPRMIYIIPTNFLYGASVSNKIRRDFLLWYVIKKVIVFEKKIFDYTGQHVGIFFFERKQAPRHHPQSFQVIRAGRVYRERLVTIRPSNNYRAGTEFDDYTMVYRSNIPVEVEYYLYEKELLENPGSYRIVCIDANRYNGRTYMRRVYHVNKRLYDKIAGNILFVKTIDGIREDEKAGLYVIREVYNVDCIVVTKAPYRTHPIQLFFKPRLSRDDQLLLKDYFNTILNYLREITDSEFMTTYKYSEAKFTRKYLGLTQVKKLIQTLPILEMTEEEKNMLRKEIENKNIEGIVNILETVRNKGTITTWLISS